VWVISLNSSNRSLQKSNAETVQAEVQKQTPEVQKGSQSQQIGGAIIKDMAAVALQNAEMKAVLAKHGFSVNAAPTPAPGAAKPAAAAPADAPAK
jgi:hypothetical protein